MRIPGFTGRRRIARSHTGPSARARGVGWLLVLLAALAAGIGIAQSEEKPVTQEETPAPADPAKFDELWNYNDPAGTERVFRELRPRLAELGDESLLLQLDTQIARTLGLQRRFDEAHALLDEVEPRLDGQPDVVRVRYLLERGRALNSSGRAEEARELFIDAWRQGRASGEDALAVDAAHMVAITEEGAEAIRWNRIALDWSDRSGDERAKKWRGSLLNNLAWGYHELGEYEQALTHFEDALMFQRRTDNMERTEIAEWCVARCLRSLGRTKEALLRQQDLLSRKEAGGRKDAYVLEEIGECLWAMDRKDEARPWLGRAWEQLSQDPWLAEREPDRLARLKSRADGAEGDATP